LQEFWEQHNTAFKEGREKFVRNILATKYPDQPDKKTLSADEMSIFYRNFLNGRYSKCDSYDLGLSSIFEVGSTGTSIYWDSYNIFGEFLDKYRSTFLERQCKRTVK
jgi:hypothetical protein